jgi:hemerythrin-like domain-containing protein
MHCSPLPRELGLADSLGAPLPLPGVFVTARGLRGVGLRDCLDDAHAVAGRIASYIWHQGRHPLRLTDALIGEHAVIYALLDHIEQELAGLDGLTDVQRLTRTLAATLLSHARVEDSMLFPALEAHLGRDGPLACMRQEHAEIEAAIEDVANAATCEAAADRLRYALQSARDHFVKEERVLFVMARQFMSERDLERLGGNWAAARGVVLA